MTAAKLLENVEHKVFQYSKNMCVQRLRIQCTVTSRAILFLKHLSFLKYIKANDYQSTQLADIISAMSRKLYINDKFYIIFYKFFKMAETLNLTYKENAEREQFLHLHPDVYGQSGTFRKPVLDGVHPTNKNGLAVTAVSNDKRYEYTVDYTKPKGVKRWWTFSGFLAMICVNKSKEKCKGKLHIKCPDLDHHDPQKPDKFNDPAKFDEKHYTFLSTVCRGILWSFPD